MWTDFSLNADGTFVHQSISCVATGVNRNGNAVLMQFTGLHDENGIEIYEGGIVYDPFGGTATTAVTAHKLGRQWICSELQPKYAKIANKRLEPYLMQESLF